MAGSTTAWFLIDATEIGEPYSVMIFLLYLVSAPIVGYTARTDSKHVGYALGLGLVVCGATMLFVKLMFDMLGIPDSSENKQLGICLCGSASFFAVLIRQFKAGA